MSATDYTSVFTEDTLQKLFPADRADQFFEAMLGDANEGAYDISLSFQEARGNVLEFEFRLSQRPGRCLACNLTYGLPQVFTRHPVINVKGVVAEIANLTGSSAEEIKWELAPTREFSSALHAVPLFVQIG
ncbi:MAG: pancreas/duodenum homeobox protein 1 [Desulfovibrio sp.]